MRKESSIERLRRLDQEIVLLNHIQAMLEWDLETVMPEKAEGERAEELSFISRLIHERVTSPEMSDAIAAAVDEAVSEEDAALARIREKAYFSERHVPDELVTALSEAKSAAHSAWLKAREACEWQIFQPALENLVSLVSEKAQAMEPSRDPYDTMLSHYEHGMSVSVLDPVFESLENGIHRLMDELSGVHPDTSFLSAGYDSAAMEAFCRKVVTKMGFDWSRGRAGVSAHPFTSTLGADDVGITNRFTDEGLFDSIGSAMHEAGHALYEQHASLNERIKGTSVCDGASMGVHESQSRFWENIMGRSYAFWSGMYPELRKYVPALNDVSLDAFVRGINAFSPSAIRVNADELTYSLHIIIRYEVEKAIFAGSVSFSDLPHYWNELSRKILHYEVRNDSEGILQDCHWSGGDFGYFPSYAVGNIYASQFYETMNAELGEENVENALRSGDYFLITGWQNDRIWSKGAIYEPEELVMAVTGRTLDASAYINYLEKRFRGLYLGSEL